MMMRTSLGLLLHFHLTLVPVFAYKHFQQQIPNGEMVPHPCKPHFLWQRVGHENHLGGGARNIFGQDFKANNYKWTPTLCQKDSDGDGRTNGEELGDPLCTWTPGTTPALSQSLSHPGICEPFDSARCGGKPSFVKCTSEKFKCDSLHEDGVFNFTLRMPKTPVPARETTYMCMIFEFPKDKASEYHIIANEPQIDNVDVMHHIEVLGCTGEVTVPLYKPYPCGMNPGFGCLDMIGRWAVGLTGECFNPKSGFLIGGSEGYRFGVLQFHWNNPAKLSHYMDGSGMTLYATPNLRPYNSGVLVIGQMHMIVPPRKEKHVEMAWCDSKCTHRYIQNEITVTTVLNHMHYLGRAQKTELHRKDKSIVNIGEDKTYTYGSLVLHQHETGIKVFPGDELATTCTYKSTSRTTDTLFGEGIHDEMCFSLLTYFPKENLQQQSCLQFGTNSTCDWSNTTIGDCTTAQMYNPRNPTRVEIWTKVKEKCTTGHCRQECKDYAREVKHKPCYSGMVDEYFRFEVARRKDDEKLSWYAALDSCDKELMLEVNAGTGTSSAIGGVIIMLFVVIRYL